METAKHFLAAQGWTLQIKARRNGVRYLYAARFQDKKVQWRYISALSKVEQLTEEKILAQLHKQKTT